MGIKEIIDIFLKRFINKYHIKAVWTSMRFFVLLL